VLASLGVGPHVELLELSRPTRELWAARHGYDVVVENELRAPDRPPSWSKVLLVRQLLDRYDDVVWLDADAVIVDDGGDPADLLDRRRWIGLVTHRYDGLVLPNLGVFVMRRSRAARRLLDELFEADQYIHHKWWENAALLELLGYDLDDDATPKVRSTRLERHVRELDLRWNSIPHAQGAAHPYVVHFAGQSQEERVAGFREALAGSPLVLAPENGAR
jgi:hypothetical protein